MEDEETRRSEDLSPEEEFEFFRRLEAEGWEVEDREAEDDTEAS